MDYKAYIQEKFPDYTVTEELNLKYTGTTIIVINYLGGGTYFSGSAVQPVQLSVKTENLDEARAALKSFAETYSNIPVIQDNEFIRQSYSTSLVISKMNQVAVSYSHQIIVNGILIVSSNISDIKTVSIDGIEYATTQRDLQYSTVQNNERKGDDYYTTTKITKPLLQFVCSLENKNNQLCTKVGRIRQGTLDNNETFAIILTFTDNDRTESYTMRLANSSFNSSNTTIPSLTLTFMR